MNGYLGINAKIPVHNLIPSQIYAFLFKNPRYQTALKFTYNGRLIANKSSPKIFPIWEERVSLAQLCNKVTTGWPALVAEWLSHRPQCTRARVRSPYGSRP